MQCSIEVLDAAKEHSLLTLYEAKASLNITGTTSDEAINFIIQRASGEIATYCNRVFGREKVIETYREVPGDCIRMFLSHYPVVKRADIEFIESGGSEVTNYEIDHRAGMITNLNGPWAEPTIFTYTGGFNLPFESPLALRQACILYVREAHNLQLRGDASIRMIAHKESRIIYFDPSQQARAAAASQRAGSPAQQAAKDLLAHFTRYFV